MLVYLPKSIYVINKYYHIEKLFVYTFRHIFKVNSGDHAPYPPYRLLLEQISALIFGLNEYAMKHANNGKFTKTFSWNVRKPYLGIDSFN